MTMRRTCLALFTFVAAITVARADVWMVKTSGQIACKDRARLVDLVENGATVQPTPNDCVLLYPGERLIDQSPVGVGFDAYARVVRSDKSVLFVSRSAIVADTGIGSLLEERLD